jgi:hypothetical protein
MTTTPANTNEQFEQELMRCQEEYLRTTKISGTAWRVLRLKSITESLFTRVQRIRSTEEQCDEDILSKDAMIEILLKEYVEVINISFVALMQFRLIEKTDTPFNLDLDEAMTLYEHELNATQDLMKRKNHDYGEAWRSMRVSTFTDLILTKLLRIRQIEKNDGKTIISEGVDAGYQDIVNYSVFALIRLQEN